MYEDSYRHRSMFGDLLIEKPEIHSKLGVAEPWKFHMTENEQYDIQNFLIANNEMVKNQVKFLNFQGMISNGRQTSIFLGRGFDVISGEKVRGSNWSWNATLGRPLHKSEVEYSVMLGQGLSRKLACSWDQKHKVYSFSGGYEAVERQFDCPTKDMQVSVMTADSQLNALDVYIVGLLDAGYRDIDDRYLMTSLETAQGLVNSKDVTLMSVELTNSSNKDEFVKLFNNNIGRKHPNIKIMTWLEHPVGEVFIKTMDLMAIFRNFVVIVILIISTLSVVNTLIKIIKERSREIGTLRSVGFKSRQVLKLFTYETFLLALFGTGIGALASVLLTFILNSLHVRYKAGMLSEPVLFKINFVFGGYINAFVILISVSLIACLVSTKNEINKKIIENLNHV